MSKKVYVIKAKDEDELAEKITNFEKKSFATQPVQKNDGSWVAFVYVDPYHAEKERNMATENQVNFLRRKSKLTEIELAELSFEEASKKIGIIKEGKK